MKNKTVFLEEIHESVRALKKAGLDILFPVLFDLLFLILYGAAIRYFGDSIINNLYALGASMIRAEQASAGFTLKNIAFSLVKLAVVLYILYVVLQGLSWRFSRAFAAKKESIPAYLKDFSLINILWFFLFYIYLIISFMIDFHEKRTLLLSILLNIFLAAIVYFAFISYTSIGKRTMEAIRRGFKTGMHASVALKFIIMLALIIAVNWLIGYSGRISRDLMVVLGALILMPLLTLARVYFHIISKKFI